MIVSTHILSVVEKICDRVGIIIDGSMKYTNTMASIKEESLALEDLFFQLMEESGVQE